jgi:hypothetical protein
MERLRAVCSIPKKTWISLESGIHSLPVRALFMTAVAEAVLRGRPLRFFLLVWNVAEMQHIGSLTCLFELRNH